MEGHGNRKNLRILTSEVHNWCQCCPSAHLRGRSPDLLLLLVSTVYTPTVANFKLPNYLIINGNISEYLMVSFYEPVGASKSWIKNRQMYSNAMWRKFGIFK